MTLLQDRYYDRINFILLKFIFFLSMTERKEGIVVVTYTNRQQEGYVSVIVPDSNCIVLAKDLLLVSVTYVSIHVEVKRIDCHFCL